MIFNKKCTALNAMLGLILTTYMAEGICDDCCNYPEEECWQQQPILEVKAGYFFFSDSKMRKVYNDGGIDLQISGLYPLLNWLQLYGSVEYLQKNGKSLGGRQKTRIWAVPLSLGLQPVYTISPKLDYYFTIGPRYFFVHAHNDSPSLDRNKSQNGLGGFINTGFHFFAWRNLLIDIFGEYSYKRMRFHSSKRNVFTREVQVGGFAFGAGFGYAF